MAATFFGPGALTIPTPRRPARTAAPMLNGVAPPGWETTIKKMKKSGEIDNPFALAWWLQKRGAHPAKHEEDAALDAQIAEAVTLLARQGLPAVCYAAARGEAWAQAALLASAGKVY